MSRKGLASAAVVVAILCVAVWLVWSYGLDVHVTDVEITGQPTDCGDAALRFAVIGDFGDSGQPEADVAALVDSWQPEFVVTVGDNNYPHGEAETIDENIGRYYSQYIHPYKGGFGAGAQENRFWPTLGNHDWDPGHIEPYLDYFTLPGNERYYDLVMEQTHLFLLDSDPNEPDGRTSDSIQAGWLETTMRESRAPWQIVVLHHPPYASSIGRGNDEEMRWPFARWGADVVIAGHDHLYERLHQEGIPYIVNGLGGRSTGFNPVHRFLKPMPGSLVRYNRDYGAMLVNASATCLNMSFIDRSDQVIDSLTLSSGSVQ